MTTNEIISISISILALLLSVASLYYTVFYKKTAMIGCLITWIIPSVEAEDNLAKLNVNAEFSLSNTGNRELLIRDVLVHWEKPPDNDMTPLPSSSEIPYVLKPSQILLVTVDIPLFFVKQVADLKQKLFIRFRVISPDGKTYMLDKHLTARTDRVDRGNQEFDSSDWKPFRLIKPGAWN